MALTNYSQYQFGQGLDFGSFGASPGLPSLGNAPLPASTGSGESGLMGIVNQGIGALQSLGGAWLDYAAAAKQPRYTTEPERQYDMGWTPDIQGRPVGQSSGNGAVVWLLIGAAAVVLLLKVQKG